MKKIIAANLAAILTASSVLLIGQEARAEDTECRGTLGAVTVVGNLIVPDDATCTLNGTRVEGAITVKSRATFTSNGAIVTGGFQGESPTQVAINPGSSFGNNVSIRKAANLTTPSAQTVSIQGAQIGGDLQLEGNNGSVDVSGNTIRGSVQASKNNGSGIAIASNNIGNGLQCQENTPPPTGGGNIAKQKEGQCVNL